MKMSNKSYATLMLAFLLSACVVAPARHGQGIVVAPALPMVVDLSVEPYYVHGGFYYYYDNHHWNYSNSRTGPWRELPRDRYPREIRYKNYNEHYDREHDRYYR
jgi:hypothetical protein